MSAPIPDQAEVRQVNAPGPELSDNSISVPKPGGGAMRFQLDEPIPLSEQEILTAGTTDRLKQIYAEHGYVFSYPTLFIEQVNEDWEKLLLAAWDSSKWVALPDTLQPLIVQSQGIHFRIYGIVHDAGEAYKRSIESTLRSQGNWYFEYFIAGDYSFSDSFEVFEFDDFRCKRPLTRVCIGIGTFPLILLNILENEPPPFSFPSPLTDAQQESVGTKLSWRYCGVLPAYVQIDQDQDLHTRWLEVIRDRSALMALVAMGIAQKLGNSDCNILCGGFHAAQIEYFLCNPHQAPANVQAIAKEQIEFFLHNPKGYKRAMLKASLLYEAIPFFAVRAGGLILIVLIFKRWRKRRRQRLVAPTADQVDQDKSP